MKRVDFEKLNYNIVILYLSIPIIFSVLMFFNTSIEIFLLSFYQVELYPAFGRYGGVFGKDVNALGMYSTLILLFIVLLNRYKKVNNVLALLLVFLSLFSVFTSGMRTGLLVFIGLLMIMDFKLKILKYKNIFFILISIVVLLTSLYNIDEEVHQIIDFLITRYSLIHLANDFNSSGDGGNLKQAIDYFNTTLGDLEVNSYNFLFGIDASINYVDNFYIFIFFKHGIIMVILFIMSLCYLIYFSIRNKLYHSLYFILAALIVSLKGVFILSNFYMFLVLFIMHFWSQNENSYSR